MTTKAILFYSNPFWPFTASLFVFFCFVWFSHMKVPLQCYLLFRLVKLPLFTNTNPNTRYCLPSNVKFLPPSQVSKHRKLRMLKIIGPGSRVHQTATRNLNMVHLYQTHFLQLTRTPQRPRRRRPLLPT